MYVGSSLLALAVGAAVALRTTAVATCVGAGTDVAGTDVAGAAATAVGGAAWVGVSAGAGAEHAAASSMTLEPTTRWMSPRRVTTRPNEKEWLASTELAVCMRF